MGKRSRNRSEEPVDASVAEQTEQAEKEYRQLKRTMNVGAFAVSLLILGLIIQHPGGWLFAAGVLAVIEGVSYWFLRTSLERRREDRLARIRSGQQA